MIEKNRIFKIGLDAKRAFHNNTGLGVYSRSIINSLEKFHANNLTLLLINPKKSYYFKFNHIEINPKHFVSKFLHSIWRSFLWSDQLKGHMDLYHGLSGELPFNLPAEIKKVVTIHDLLFERFPKDYPFLERFFYRIKAKYACKNADAIIAVSEATKKDIIDFYKIPAEKIWVIGIPFSQIKVEPKAITEINNPFILCVASFLPRKNQENLVIAFEKIAKNVNFDLILIGRPKGEYYKKVKKKIDSSPFTNRIHILSHLDDNQMAWLYSNAIFSVYPSLYEGFGIPVLESFLYNCPLLASEIQSTLEISKDVPLFFKSESIEDLADKMIFLYQNINQYKENTIIHQNEILAKYSDEHISHSIFKIYKNLIGK